jgi:hypothetical protein
VRDGRRGVTLGMAIVGVVVHATDAGGSAARVGTACGTTRSCRTAVGTGGRVGGTGTAVGDDSIVGGAVGAAATVAAASATVTLGSWAGAAPEPTLQSPKTTAATKPSPRAPRMLRALQ